MTKAYTIEDPLYSRSQTCGYISIDDRTLDRWVASHKFPKPDLYLGRYPRWRLSTVNAYLEQKKREHQEKQLSN